jgi:hypothetical protein
MNIIFCNSTHRTPYIAFEENSLELFGNFIPKNPKKFYEDLNNWIIENEIKPPLLTEIHIGIIRVRHRGIVFIEKTIRKMILSDKQQQPINIVWFYSRKSLGLSAGKRLSKKLNFPFEYFQVRLMLEMYR